MKVSELRKVIKEEISSMIGEATSISTWPDDEIIGIFNQLKDKSSNIYKRFAEEMKKRNLDVAYNQSITDLEDFYGGKRPDNMNEDWPKSPHSELINKVRKKIEDVTVTNDMLKAFNLSGGPLEKTIEIINDIEKEKKIEDWTYEDVEYLISQLPYPEVYGDVYGTGIQRENHINENKLVNMFQKRAGLLNEMDERPYSTSSLERFAIALKKSIDSDDRFSIRPIPPTRIDGKMYYGIEKDDPERFNQFKYGSYAVEEPWGAIASMLGLDFEGEGYGKDTYDTIDKLMVSLRAKKLIDLEW